VQRGDVRALADPRNAAAEVERLAEAGLGLAELAAGRVDQREVVRERAVQPRLVLFEERVVAAYPAAAAGPEVVPDRREGRGPGPRVTATFPTPPPARRNVGTRPRVLSRRAQRYGSIMKRSTLLLLLGLTMSACASNRADTAHPDAVPATAPAPAPVPGATGPTDANPGPADGLPGAPEGPGAATNPGDLSGTSAGNASGASGQTTATPTPPAPAPGTSPQPMPPPPGPR